jgi:hypothetical protein
MLNRRTLGAHTGWPNYLMLVKHSVSKTNKADTEEEYSGLIFGCVHVHLHTHALEHAHMCVCVCVCVCVYAYAYTYNKTNFSVNILSDLGMEKVFLCTAPKIDVTKIKKKK